MTALHECSGWMPGILRDLRRDEGVRRSAYKDHLGFLTIGVGRLIDARRGGGLSESEIDILLENDVRACIADLTTLPAWGAVKDDPVRSRALVNMRFQLGPKGLRGFRRSLASIEAKEWAAAAANLRKSLWARQTPKRAERVIHMIETGKEPE